MDRKGIFLVFIMTNFINLSFGQIVDIPGEKFESLLIDSVVNYRTKRGDGLGCEFSLECGKLRILFEHIFYDSTTKFCKISGRVLDARKSNEYAGVPNVTIFLARVQKGLIYDIENIGATEFRTKGGQSGSPEEGDFEINFRIEYGVNLFFIDPVYLPVIYDLQRIRQII